MLRSAVRTGFLVALLGVRSLLPTDANAQLSGNYGSGERPRLSYLGESFRGKMFIFALDVEAAYDDNVFSNGEQRRDDLLYRFGPRIAFRRELKEVIVAFDYQPDYLLFQKTNGRDTVNHRLAFDLGYNIGPRVVLRLRDSLRYRTGIFESRAGEDVLFELGSPTSLNESVFTPLARRFENLARIDVEYSPNPQHLVGVHGGYLQRDLSEEATSVRSFNDTRGFSAGLRYSHRRSQRTTVGASYQFQRLRFEDVEESHVLVHSTLFTFMRQLSPTVTFDLAAGPEYARGTRNSSGSRWGGGASASLTKQLQNTVFRLYGRRRFTDGGGILTASTTTSGGVSVARRLGRRSNLILRLTYGRTSNGGFQGNSTLESQRASISLDRHLTERLGIRLRYDFIRQRRSGQVSSLSEFNRNRATLALFYVLGGV